MCVHCPRCVHCGAPKHNKVPWSPGSRNMICRRCGRNWADGDGCECEERKS